MPGPVFVSHAREDAEVAVACASVLERRGLQCWLAARDIPPGADYLTAIAKALDAARAVLVVLSRHANASAWVAREVERAAAKHLPTFVVRLEDVPPAAALELVLSGVQWLDAWPTGLDHAIGVVAEAIGAGTPPPPPRPPSPRRRWRRLGAVAGLASLALLAVGWWFARSARSTHDSPEHASRAFVELLDARSYARAWDRMVSARSARTASREQALAQLALAREARPGTPSARELVLDTRSPAIALGQSLQPGSFTIHRYQTVTAGQPLCEDVWLEDEGGGATPRWKVSSYYAWAAPCASRSSFEQAAPAALEFLRRVLEHRRAAGVMELLDPLAGGLGEAAVQRSLDAFVMLAGRMSAPSLRFAIPMPPPVPGAYPGTFAWVRISDPGAALAADVWLHELAPGTWRIAFFLAGPG